MCLSLLTGFQQLLGAKFPKYKAKANLATATNLALAHIAEMTKLKTDVYCSVMSVSLFGTLYMLLKVFGYLI